MDILVSPGKVIVKVKIVPWAYNELDNLCKLQASIELHRKYSIKSY